MYVCLYVCLSVCMSVCMYVSLHFPFAPQYFPQKTLFFQRFRKDDVQKPEFFQIFGKRMQEAQASNKAGRGNRAWDPCFATPGPRRLRLVERHQIAVRSLGGAPPPHVSDVGWGGGLGGGVILYPLLGVRHAEQCRRIHTRAAALCRRPQLAYNNYDYVLFSSSGLTAHLKHI